MKLSTRARELFTQLQTVTRVASTRSAVQALSGVQIPPPDGGVELRATDMEVGLRVPLEARGRPRGRVVLPGRLLLDVVRALPADEVSLELRTAEQDVELISGSATFHIRTLRAEDFPPLPEPDGDDRLDVPGAGARRDRPKVARAASRDETRPVLTGILVSAPASELRMVATDSYRLASRTRSSRRRSTARSRPTCRRGRCRSSTRIVQHGRRRAHRRLACGRTRSCSRPAASCSPRG